MSLRDFGWETYRIRSHSIPASLSNTDTFYTADRRISKGGTVSSSSPGKNIALQVTPPSSAGPSDSSDQTAKQPSTDATPGYRFSLQHDSTPADVKSRRSLTMPSTFLVNATEKSDVRNGKSFCIRLAFLCFKSIKCLLVIIPEEIGPATPTNNIAMVTFQEFLDPAGAPLLVGVPIRRCSSISKELINTPINRDSGIASGATGSFSDVEYSRSPTYSTHLSHPSSQFAAAQTASDSLPLERFRPRSKSAHQSNALRQSKQLQKVPEVIQALRAPTAGHGVASEPSATDELYRSRLLRCNFLLKPDAAGYEYARRVQKICHATYSHSLNSNQNDSSLEETTRTQKNFDLVSPFHRYTSKFYKKIYESHELHDQQVDKFLSEDG